MKVLSTETGNKTFYAKWAPESYTITLNTNGGAIKSGNVTTHIYGTEVTLPTNVTKAGYVFDGWKDNEALDDSRVTVIPATEMGNKIYNAQWIDNIDPVMKSLTASNTNWTNQDVILYGRAIDTGSGIVAYQFSQDEELTSQSNGWNEIPKVRTEIAEEYTVSSNGTYYFYVKDDEGNINSNSITIENIDKQKPTISGFEVSDKGIDSFKVTASFMDSFSGISKIRLYYKKAADTQYQQIQQIYSALNDTTPGSTEEMEKTIEVKNLNYDTTYDVYLEVYDVAGNAVQTEEIQVDIISTAIVTFKSDGEIVATKNVIIGKDVEAPVLTKPGYTLSWDKDLTNVRGSMEVNAVWTPGSNITYKVEYYLQDKDTEVEGYQLQEEQILEGATDSTVTAQIKDYQGFTYDSENANNVISAVVKANGTTLLKVYYKRNTYKISYVLNGGQGNNLSTTYVYDKQFILSKNVTKDGFRFVGWFDNPELNGTPVTNITEGTTGDKTFYAKWVDASSVQKADLNGDGNVTLLDLSLLNQTIVGKISLTDYQNQAADINNDNQVTLLDLSLLNQVIVGKYSL